MRQNYNFVSEEGRINGKSKRQKRVEKKTEGKKNEQVQDFTQNLEMRRAVSPF